jgi:DNA ligase (NAD+)
VLIERANDVIPHVHSVLPAEPGDELAPINMPENCPDCGTRLVQQKSKLMCNGTNCTGQLLSKLKNWCKMTGTKGIAEATLTKLLEDESVQLEGIHDLYRLTEDDWLRVIGGATARKSYQALRTSMLSMPLSTFLGALGIAGMHDKTAERVAAGLSSASKLIGVEQSTITSIPQLTGHVADKIYTALVQRKDEITWLAQNLHVIDHVQVQGVLTGKVFCVTGDRGNLPQLIQENGGEYTDSLGKRCDMLIMGSAGMNGSKVERAKLFQIPIVSKEEFLALLTGAQ